MKSLAWFICRKWAVDLAAVNQLTLAASISGPFAADRVNPATLTNRVSAHLENLSSLTSINLLDTKPTENYFSLGHIAAAKGAHLSANQAARPHFRQIEALIDAAQIYFPA